MERRDGRDCPGRRGGITLIEVVIALTIVVVLLAILVPALTSARRSSRRAACADHLRRIGDALDAYVDEHGALPLVRGRAGWEWGGLRRRAGEVALDPQRPLNAAIGAAEAACLCCPSDRGIGAAPGVGTAGRTACVSFGTSYRANHLLLDAAAAGLAATPRGIRLAEITTPPSRLIVMGDPVWYEVLESTGRRADWHGVPGAGNLLFLDGSVKFMAVTPRPGVGPAVIEPALAPAAPAATAP